MTVLLPGLARGPALLWAGFRIFFSGGVDGVIRRSSAVQPGERQNEQDAANGSVVFRGPVAQPAAARRV
jgi:hypothetical protein